MTKNDLLRTYDALMLCVENGKYGETKETVRKWLEWAVDAYGIEQQKKAYELGRTEGRIEVLKEWNEEERNRCKDLVASHLRTNTYEGNDALIFKTTIEEVVELLR